VERLDALGLQAFVCVAELGSFRLASIQLNLSATAVSRRVQKLEQMLGVQLLSRTTRTVTLTPIGADFLPRSQDLLEKLEGALEDVRIQGRSGERAIRLGCLPTIASCHLPPILEKFASNSPNPIQIFDLAAPDILECVRSGKVDFGISFIGADHHDLTIIPLYTEPLIVFVSPNADLAKVESINWVELSGQQLISIGAYSGTRRLIDEALQANDIELNWTYEVQHISTAINLAKSGLGIAVLPLVAKTLARPHLATVSLNEPKIERRIGLIRRNDLALIPAAKLLFDIVTRELRGITSEHS